MHELIHVCLKSTNKGEDMKTLTTFTFIILSSIFTINSSAMAAAPAACADLPDSIGVIPIELQQLCSNQSPQRQALALAPPTITLINKVQGWEAFSDQLNEFMTDTPEVVSPVGGTDFGSFVSGCDYAGNDFSKIYCADSGGNLFTSDATTGSTTLVGNFGALNDFEATTSLDWDPTTETMYMQSTNGGSGSLYTLDLITAVATRVGATTGSKCPIAGGFDNAGQLWSYDVCSDNMYSINKTTGAASLVGPIGFNANYGQGMDFDPVTNTCYMFAYNGSTLQTELRTCDTNTGSTTLVGVIGSTTPGSSVQFGGAAIAIQEPSFETPFNISGTGCPVGSISAINRSMNAILSFAQHDVGKSDGIVADSGETWKSACNFTLPVIIPPGKSLKKY